MKVLAVISQHGFGHLAQAAPVLNAMRVLQPGLALTIWSGLDATALQSRIEGRFEHRQEPADVGLIMQDAMRVDPAASHAAYQAFHADWAPRVSREAAWLREHAFDRVFSDVAYLPLAAAGQAGIPGFALCSLNWVDIARAYLSDLPGMAAIFEQMQAAYDAASMFLQPTPSMPMPQLARRREIAPIAMLGRNRREELAQRLALSSGTRLALLGFGGIGYQGPGRLPEIENSIWLAPDSWQTETSAARADLIPFSRTGMTFLDLLASSDVLITKVGYGSFVEAAAHAVPVLYLDRPDWPETPYLAAWLAEHCNAMSLDEAALFSERLTEILQVLWRKPRKTAIQATGAEQAARQLLAR